ncbi:hypothetical protein [Streptomyces erythrochromogenes]|uniref:hypothetical protein n=1 Tax=Streptomyces erythrochromogenes TaxID=285574 RepID=UPI00386FACBD|nr:hypothetical protein OG489_31875 [Streptomyces erythrochromogenes]
MTTLRARAYDREFRHRAHRQRVLGIRLLTVASLIWLWMAYLLLVPFTAESGGKYGGEISCRSMAFHNLGEERRVAYSERHEKCNIERDPGVVLAWLLLSVPVAATGLFQFASGSSALRISEQMVEYTRLASLPEE